MRMGCVSGEGADDGVHETQAQPRAGWQHLARCLGAVDEQQRAAETARIVHAPRQRCKKK